MSPSLLQDPLPKQTMDSVVAVAKTAFQSARLKYIKIDEADEHIKAFIPDVDDDPLMQVLASPDMLRPKGKKDIDHYMEQQSKSFLGVAVCLLPEEESKHADEERRSGSDDGDENGVREGGKENKTETTTAGPTIIGTMCLGWGGQPQSMSHHRNSSIGITLATKYQNKGYGREAINWMLDWAFRHAGMHTVSIVTYSFNERGAHLYRDIGFQLEGRRRQVAWFDRKWYDELWFGMTEGEWEKLRGLV
ncbi:hypothetical protein RJ55_06539 [Drechmeria coniospora]|nr:hypothetical protein RJ55_06539 [Drechmeria coniospora]